MPRDMNGPALKTMTSAKHRILDKKIKISGYGYPPFSQF